MRFDSILQSTSKLPSKYTSWESPLLLYNVTLYLFSGPFLDNR